MSKFSESLRAYLSQRDFTNTALAEKIGVSRSFFQRVLSGELKLKREQLDALLLVLKCTPTEAAELNELYLMSLSGEAIADQREQVKNFIERLANHRGLALRAVDWDETPVPSPGRQEDQLLRGKKQIRAAIAQSLAQEKTAGTGRIDYFTNDELVYDYVTDYLHAVESASVRELICFDKGEIDLDAATRTNLNATYRLLTNSFAFGRAYQPYYYYLKNLGDLSLGVAMPFFVRTAAGAILFSEKMDLGLRVTSATFLTVVGGKIDDIFARANPLLTVSDNVFEAYGKDQLCAAQRTIEPSACFARYFTPEILTHLSALPPTDPGFDEIYNFAKSLYLDTPPEFWGLAYSPFEGLVDFAEEGLIRVIPRSFIKPLPLADRLAILEGLLADLADSDQDLYCAIDGERFETPLDMEILTADDGVLTFRRHSGSQQIITVEIRESTICNAFADFMTNLPYTPYVYSRCQTIDLLTALIAGLKAKISD